MRILFFFLSFLLINICHAQKDVNRCNYLNAVFVVDNEITRVFNGKIIVVDSINKQNDTIPFTNNHIGTIIFKEDAYNKFLSINPYQEVLIKFEDAGTPPTYNGHNYEERIQAKWLNYGFIIFRIYNYANKKNWKEFPQRKGYGIEWQASERSKIIPRRAR